MNITKKGWFCSQCSLQFDSQHVYSLHLEHVHKIETKSINNGFKSNEPLACNENLDSRNQIVSGQDENKTLKCASCQYRCSLQDHLIALSTCPLELLSKHYLKTISLDAKQYSLEYAYTFLKAAFIHR